MHMLPFTAGLLALAGHASAKQLSCNASELAIPEYFGTKVLRLQAKEVLGKAPFHPMNLLLRTPEYEMKPIDFCNVTVTYTHPGLNDELHVHIWLPLKGWNGRFMGIGGGGLATGFKDSLAPAVELGYAAANTDGGHSMEAVQSSESWSLKSPGNVDINALQNFASVALDDMAGISKLVIQNFYGKAPKYSYWNGCSTGGRQGLMLAQRYPKNYDGILAAAPAVHWTTLSVVMFLGQFHMAKEKYYPPPCEMEAIHQAAVEACDTLDGVKDGIISAHGLCTWDPKNAVGRKCCDGKKKVSKAAARLATAIYHGMDKAEKPASLGATRDTAFATSVKERMGSGGLLQTECDDDLKNCKPRPFGVNPDWIKYFLKKDPDFDALTIRDEAELYRLLHQSQQVYGSLIATDDSDLSEFKAAGGKMITWHGLSDQLLFANSTSYYYQQVLAKDPKAQDFYRYFEVPGVAHCMGGPGAHITNVFGSLVDWVEKGKKPDVLEAATLDYDSKDKESKKGFTRKICPWPQVAQYTGGDARKSSSFKCAADFGKKKGEVMKDEL